MGKWLAIHGPDGNITFKRDETDFMRLNRFLFFLLAINFFGSVGPWSAVIYICVRQDHVEEGKIEWIAILVGLQIMFFSFMSLWEICIRRVRVFSKYHQEGLVDLRENIGLSRDKGNDEDIIEHSDHDMEESTYHE